MEVEVKEHPILEQAMASGRTSLTESESKKVLSAYGVPVVEESVAASPEEAVSLAAICGFPVVVKGLGESITHKTEMGLVAVGLSNEDAVLGTARTMADRAGDALDGFLVQPLVEGDRELVAGLFTDPLFGPVIMFGIGGVFTEALEDVAFRLAPCSRQDILSMVSEIRSQKLLGEFRGQGAVDQEAVIQTLSGLSRLAVEHPEVAEVDINPLKVLKDGSLVAVDALVVLRPEKVEADYPPPIAPEDVGRFFVPGSVALVGASAVFGKWGHMVATCLLGGDYEGEVYLVNPKGGEILGKPVYKSVSEIPDQVDLACVTIPAAHVEALIPEFQAKGITHVLLITSGFGETGPEGKVLEKSLVDKARKAGILILGPNTMGINNPHLKFYCSGSHIRPEPGSTALLSQSGNMGGQLMTFALGQGVGIRAFCGSGNEAMITIEDGLEAFEADEATKTVVLYLESVKNGRRFYESARRLGRKKPVVVLKGGRTEAGGKAAASHTGAMASDIKVFDAACRQAGVVSVDRPMDLLDLSAAFSSLPLPPGNRVAVMTLGGGWGVVTADLCNKFKLEVPSLTGELINTIDQILPPFWSRSNPIDLVGENNPRIFFDVADELARWDGCDAVVVLGIIGRKHSISRMIESTVASDPQTHTAELEARYKTLSEYEESFVTHLCKLMDEFGKPFVGVYLGKKEGDGTVLNMPGCKYSGVFFETPERAVKALSGMHEYQSFLNLDGKK